MPQSFHAPVGMLGLFGLPGYWEIIIVILLILLLFGGKKLPELARGLARGLRIFKDEMKGIKTDVEDSISDDSRPADKDLPSDKAKPDEKNPSGS